MSNRTSCAALFRIRGLVQGVGFRPFVFRAATAHGLTGWVRNADAGVDIHVEGPADAIDAFARSLGDEAPAAARISSGLEARAVEVTGAKGFRIRESRQPVRPTAAISPDLSVCTDCQAELVDARNRRSGYPYLTCAGCGPRYSIVVALPYDRLRTTMSGWPLCPACAAEYADRDDRRFHAESIACATCGPGYRFIVGSETLTGDAVWREAARQLREGAIVAIKGIGGYHLACDGTNGAAVERLRTRKFRKERAFALMARDLDAARALVSLSPESEALLSSPTRPIVLAPPRRTIAGIAPAHPDYGIMLPYAPLHTLLFASGAPAVLVLTSGNRSNEPIAYEDDDARMRLAGIADAFLIGDRPIARRVDDSIARAGRFGPMILRRSRGFAPAAVAHLPTNQSILAAGADLKNTVTIVVGGEAFVSQHLGDLDQYQNGQAFEQTIADLLQMYDIDGDQLTVVHDRHPEYISTRYALERGARTHVAIQHHQAHVASVLGERGEFERRVLGVVFDGTGYGDDGTIWGGEWFAGSVAEGLTRVAHLRHFALPGGDAAARHPVQAAAGMLAALDTIPDLTGSPFLFPRQYSQSRQLLERSTRTFTTSSIGRLFDTVAALLGFTRPITFEGQAALWLEHLATTGGPARELPFAFIDRELDFRDAIAAVIARRIAGEPVAEIARAFHDGLATGVTDAVVELCEAHDVDTVVLSGGVFQNELLLRGLGERLTRTRLRIWTNNQVPPNDGGISLGQATLAAVSVSGRHGATTG